MQSWKEKQELVADQSQPGHTAWAARQSTMWRSMAVHANSKFATLLKSHPPPEFAQVIPPDNISLMPTEANIANTSTSFW
jgi:hypothetical protein